MEGLGLLPLEAYLCGCVPIMTRKGAPDLIFGDDHGVVWMESPLGYQDLEKVKLHAEPKILDCGLRRALRALKLKLNDSNIK